MVMTLGGSRFPGALGAMLIEVLPFLRNVATDVRQVLGDDSPSLVPTVMAAYALTSLLIGICFVMLGILRAGNLVSRSLLATQGALFSQRRFHTSPRQSLPAPLEESACRSLRLDSACASPPRKAV